MPQKYKTINNIILNPVSNIIELVTFRLPDALYIKQQLHILNIPSEKD